MPESRQVRYPAAGFGLAVLIGARKDPDMCLPVGYPRTYTMYVCRSVAYVPVPLILLADRQAYHTYLHMLHTTYPLGVTWVLASYRHVEDVCM